MRDPAGGQLIPVGRRMWFSRRALWLHFTVVAVVPTFLGLFWWQVQRVRQGNALSWAYVFEWPFFTGYAIYMWWRLVHEQPAPAGGGAGEAAGILEGTGAAAGASVGATPPSSYPAGAGAPAGTSVPNAPSGPEGDDELAAYNRYLTELAASGRRKRW